MWKVGNRDWTRILLGLMSRWATFVKISQGREDLTEDFKGLLDRDGRVVAMVFEGPKKDTFKDQPRHLRSTVVENSGMQLTTEEARLG